MPRTPEEHRLRHLAARSGYAIAKYRGRDRLEPGYMLVNASINGVVLGGHPIAYSATLEEIEEFLKAY